MDRKTLNQEYAQFFKVFTRVSKAIHAGENTDEILENIVTHIAEIFNAKGCIFWIVDRAQNRIKAESPMASPIEI